jgi:hypothetical protein
VQQIGEPSPFSWSYANHGTTTSPSAPPRPSAPPPPVDESSPPSQTSRPGSIESGGVSEKELSELLSRDLLIPVAHGVTYDAIRSVSPLLGSRNGLNTAEDSMEEIAELVAV